MHNYALVLQLDLSVLYVYLYFNLLHTKEIGTFYLFVLVLLFRLDLKECLILGANPKLRVGSPFKAGLWLYKQSQVTFI